MTRFLNAGNIPLLVAVCIVLLTPLSARGATPPSVVGPPSRIREPTPPSQQVKDYFTIAKQDAERARQYLKTVEAQFAAFRARIDSLNAQAGQLVNMPAHELLTTYPKFRGAELNTGHGGLGWFIGEKEKEYWVQEIPSGGIRPALKRIDNALGTATAYIKPIVYFDARAAEQGEKTQLRNVDELENTLLEGLRLAFNNRLSLRRQELRWELGFLDAQATLRTLQGWVRWSALLEPIAKDLNSARNAADKAGTFTRDEPKLFADAMARLAPLCTDASKKDAVYVTEAAARVQALVERFKADYKSIVAEPAHLVAEIYKNQSGIKAELGAAARRWLQDITNDKNFGLPRESLDLQTVRVDWQAWAPNPGQYVSSGENSVAAADERTRLNTPSCLDWNAQMPTDLANRFPAVDSTFYGGRWVSLGINSSSSPPGRMVAQGGRVQIDGP